MLSRQVLVTLPDTLKQQWQSISEELAKLHGIQASGEFPLPSFGVDCLVYKVPERQKLEQVIRNQGFQTSCRWRFR
ncbi:MAG: hypothetical protein PHO08_04830 [Methylococcales bacterium]|nr:hypothetical protein [Methylococcales bacterium]